MRNASRPRSTLEFHTQIDRLAKAGLLYLVTEKFANIDLHPEAVSNAQMGVVFEELIRKFAEISNETAGVLTAVENGGAGTVSRRSKMAAHNRAVLCEGRIGATAPITPPFRERHRSALRHGDLERDTA